MLNGFLASYPRDLWVQVKQVTPDVVRILLIADTHLGFDLPFRPRIKRRRRGHDFFANFERALQPAVRGEVHLVVHGGDLLYRSKVPAALVEMAMAPLVRVADQGTPVYLVPGNHERSRIPLHLWAAHPNLFIFDEPRTYLCLAGGRTLALSGFPFSRGVRDVFGELVDRTGYREVSADIHLLCVHQAVEGAQVGVIDYTFRSGPEVVRGSQIPGGFSAVLSGHIHRTQVLTHDLEGRPLAAPVVYPGSIERTSFAEWKEGKNYVILAFNRSGDHVGQLADVSIVPLLARPMVNLVIQPQGLSGDALMSHVAVQLRAIDPDAVVRVQLRGPGSQQAREFLSAARLRTLAPPSMNVTLAFDRSQLKGRKGAES